MDVDPDAIVVERRFEGPPGSGQGGWSSALFADRLPYRASVSLRAPIPFERPLRIEGDGEGHRLVDDARGAADGGPTVIMTAREWTPDVPDTPPVTIDAARAARSAFVSGTMPTDDDDSWRESAILMASTRDDELVNPELSATQLLFRLFHERGVRVFDPVPLAGFCQCSRERIEDVLSQFPAEEMADMVVDGKIAVTCEFCSRVYEFDPPSQ